MTRPDLERFVRAQDAHRTHDSALDQLRAGRKTGHWMWFVFPQLVGLGRSAMSREYALHDLAEARAYLAHPALGPRLHACCRALLDLDPERVSAVQVLGAVDADKLRSSMTLFAAADPDDAVFPRVLDRLFDGDRCTVTLRGVAPEGR